MNKAIVVAGALALCLGFVIGAQATLVNRSGRLIGPIPTGLLLNFAAGMVATLVLVALTTSRGSFPVRLSREVIVIMAIAGVFNVASISTFAFVLGRIGVSATLTAVILGQLAVGVIVDTFGLGGVEPIPLNLRRVAGLAAMGAAMVLLLPRNE